MINYAATSRGGSLGLTTLSVRRILSSNSDRVGLTLTNIGTNAILIRFGSSNVTYTNAHIQLVAGASYTFDKSLLWRGDVYAISYGGNSTIRFCEFLSSAVESVASSSSSEYYKSSSSESSSSSQVRALQVALALQVLRHLRFHLRVLRNLRVAQVRRVRQVVRVLRVAQVYRVAQVRLIVQVHLTLRAVQALLRWLSFQALRVRQVRLIEV